MVYFLRRILPTNGITDRPSWEVHWKRFRPTISLSGWRFNSQTFFRHHRTQHSHLSDTFDWHPIRPTSKTASHPSPPTAPCHLNILTGMRFFMIWPITMISLMNWSIPSLRNYMWLEIQVGNYGVVPPSCISFSTHCNDQFLTHELCQNGISFDCFDSCQY